MTKLIKDIHTEPGQLPPKRPLGRPAISGSGQQSGKRPLNPTKQRHSGTNIDGVDRRRAGTRTAERLSSISAKIEEKVVLQPIIDQKRNPLILPTRATIRTRNFILQNSVIAIIAVAMAYSSVVGQAIIGIYMLAGLLLKFDSRYSFVAALIFLIGVPFFQAIGMTGVSENSAIYAYEMLVVGVAQAIVESFRSKGSSTDSKEGTGVAPL